MKQTEKIKINKNIQNNLSSLIMNVKLIFYFL